MELPTYKIPSLKHVLTNLWIRSKLFLKRAGTYILFISMALWFLATYPSPPKDWEGSAITYSYAGRMGKAIEPLIEPLGFDWRIATGLVPGFAAREVMVGALGTTFAIENADDESVGMKSLQEKLLTTWGIPTGLALLVWYIFSPQCLATFAVIRRETNSWKWPLISFTYMLALAYIFAFITFKTTSLFL